jgi:hypothetical protein
MMICHMHLSEGNDEIIGRFTSKLLLTNASRFSNNILYVCTVFLLEFKSADTRNLGLQAANVHLHLCIYMYG